MRSLAISSNNLEKRLPIKALFENGKSLFNAGQGVFVSEPLAYHQKLEVGDNLSMVTDSGIKDFRILGIYYDYISSRGVIALHLGLYQDLWSDQRISGLTLFRDQMNHDIDLVSTVEKVLYTV